MVFVWIGRVVSHSVQRGDTAADDGLVGGAAWATTNWWYAHNVLGLYVTPMGLATIYYLIPKVTGKPIYSYHLSLLGFWTNALFYSWIGTHHLVGGPLPAWVITLGIVGSIMMFVPVTTVAINHHMTMVGKFHMLKTSPTLRFIVFGARVIYRRELSGIARGAAIGEPCRAFHALHGCSCASRNVFFLHDDDVRGNVLHSAAPDTQRVEFRPLIKIHFWTTALGVLAYFWL